MGLFDLFRRGPNQDNVDHARIIAMNENKERSEIEENMLIGIKKHLIKDDKTLQILDLLSYQYGDVIDPKTKQKVRVPVGLDPVGSTLRILVSPLNAVRFLSESDANLFRIQIEGAMLLLEANMDRSNYNLETHVRLKSLEMWAIMNLLDSIKGRKAKLLNLQAKQTTVEVGERDKKKESLY